MGVFNTLIARLSNKFHWGDSEAILSGLVTTMVPLGATFGSFVGAPLSYLGRRRGMMINNTVLIVGCGIQLIASVETICVGRFVQGVSSGIFSVIVPKFINEVSPVFMSGSFGAIYQFMVTLGLFAAFLIGLGSKEHPSSKKFFEEEYWRIMFAIPIFVALVQMILLWKAYPYETPKFLLKTKQDSEARDIIELIYGEENLDPALKQIAPNESLTTFNETEIMAPLNVSWSELFKPRYRYALFVGCALSMLQQLSGINMLIFYSS